MLSGDSRTAELVPAEGPSGSLLAVKSMRHNLVASVVGQAWVAVVQLAFIPVYIKLLGIEAYGLIGFFAFLQTSLQLFDLGLSPTMSRELARITRLGDRAKEARDLVRTLETLYWGIGLAIGLVLVAAGPLLATRWLKPSALPVDVVERALRTMGLVAALQWPLSLYQAGLNGLHRQRTVNLVRGTFVTVGSFGAALLLVVVGRSIAVFFAWQVIVAAAQLVATRAALWRHMPRYAALPSFDAALIHRIRHFAGGMSGIMLSTIALTQLDKLILSRMLTLPDFGYYMLASVISSGVYIVVIPLFNIFFPYFTTLVAASDTAGLRVAYHFGTQLMAALVIPIGLTLSLLAPQVIFVWTGDAETARRSGPILSILALGSTINGLMNIPYALQLAYGWTSIALKINAFLVATLVPAIIILTRAHGAVGAATVWLLLNLVYLASGIPLTHRRALPGEAGRWFFGDVSPPLLAASVLPLLAFAFVSRQPMPRWLLAVLLVTVVMISTLGAALSAPTVRRALGTIVVRFRAQVTRRDAVDN